MRSASEMLADPTTAAAARNGVDPRSAPMSAAGRSDPPAAGRVGWRDGLACAVFLVLALGLGTYNLTGSGSLWPDAARYSNGGAMVHDWLTSGELLHPYDFALKNYTQYPAFNIPYHPPVYPGLLGVFFLGTGVSYEAARTFTALCLAGSVCFFFLILRRGGVNRWGAMTCSLLLLTMPEMAAWSRDTMSEIPGLVFILAASYFFLRWVDSERPGYCWLAFGLAELAFLSRLLTGGVLVGWFLYLLLRGQWRRFFSPHLIVAAVLYAAVGGLYVKWAGNYGLYEVPANHLKDVVAWKWNASYFAACWPAAVPLGLLVAALAGAVFALRQRRTYPLGMFWLCVLGGYCLFKMGVLTQKEPRYLLYALPAFPGLAACLFFQEGERPRWRWLGPGLVVAAFVTNAIQLYHLPTGMVGYEPVARQLAQLERPGNFLMATWDEQDLIFRYRGQHPSEERRIIRGDRSLAIRTWAAGLKAPEQFAHSREDVLAMICRARARYLVTCHSDDGLLGRTREMELAHEVANSSPGQFRLLGEYTLEIDYSRGVRGVPEMIVILKQTPLTLSSRTKHRGRVYVWEYLGELPDGPSDLPVRIPTANMEFDPK